MQKIKALDKNQRKQELSWSLTYRGLFSSSLCVCFVCFTLFTSLVLKEEGKLFQAPRKKIFREEAEFF
jgi:alpha-tubulin suppressor-like RCC1 family protein